MDRNWPPSCSILRKPSIIVLLVTTRPIAGGHYMYPIYPFNWHALRALLIRRPIAPDNT